MSLPAVSQHLKVLETAGLVTRGRSAQWRPCRLEPKALKEATEWLDQYRRVLGGELRQTRPVPQGYSVKGN